MDKLPGDVVAPLSLPTLAGGSARVGSGAAQLLFFFKVDCPTSPFAVPSVEALRRAYQPLGAQVLAVSQDEAPETRGWLERVGLSGEVALDAPRHSASALFGLAAVPACVLLNGSQIEIAQEGWSREGYERISERLARLLGVAQAAVLPEGGPAFRPG